MTIDENSVEVEYKHPENSFHYPVRQDNESSEDYMDRLQKIGFTIASNPENLEPHFYFNESAAEKLPPLNPEQIADYIHQEFTPYSQMSLEDGKKHLAELIKRHSDYELQKYKVSIELP